MQQVVRRLRLSGLVKVKRGPGGGVSLVKGVQVKKIFEALQPLAFLQPEEYIRYRVSDSFEERMLTNLATSMQYQINQMLQRPIEDLVMDLKAKEIQLSMKIADDKEYN